MLDLFFIGLQVIFQDQLHEYEIEPAAEFVANLIEMTGGGKAKLFVQVDADLVLGVDACEDGMEAGVGGVADKGAEEIFSDAFSALVFVDVDGMFDGVFVR